MKSIIYTASVKKKCFIVPVWMWNVVDCYISLHVVVNHNVGENVFTGCSFQTELWNWPNGCWESFKLPSHVLLSERGRTPSWGKPWSRVWRHRVSSWPRRSRSTWVGVASSVSRPAAHRTAVMLLIVNPLLHVSRQTDGGDRGAQSSAGPEGGGTLLPPVGGFVKWQHIARIHRLENIIHTRNQSIWDRPLVASCSKDIALFVDSNEDKLEKKKKSKRSDFNGNIGSN